MKIIEVVAPVYKSDAEFYAGGKELYQQYRAAFPRWPEQVAKDIYNQTQPGTNPDIITPIKNGADPKQVFLDYFTGKKLGKGKVDALTGLNTAQLTAALTKGTWSEEVLTVNPGDFAAHTLNKMKQRNFLRTAGPDEDPVRIARGRQFAQATAATGNNEPVTLIRTREKKLVLWEGWHRTMSILALGDNGNADPTKWDKVKLKAFVCENW